jgi:hypothetical protein
MGKIINLLVPKSEMTFLYGPGGEIQIEKENVEEVLRLTIDLSKSYRKPQEEEHIRGLTHQQRLDLLLTEYELMIKEVEVNDDIEKLPKKIRYGNGLWQPEILIKLNNKRKIISHMDDNECNYENFPGGIYLWEIRYKEISKNRYMNTNNARAFSSEHLVGTGVTLSDAVFEIEKGLRTKSYQDFSILDEEQKEYFDGKK